MRWLLVIAACLVPSVALAQPLDEGPVVAPDEPAAAPVVPVPAPATCDAVTFRDEVLFRSGATNLCPKPADAVRAEQGLRLAHHGQELEQVFEVLRAIRDRLAQESDAWSVPLARGIDRGLAEARAGNAPRGRFSAARDPLPQDYPHACLFVMGDRFAPDFACVLIPGVPAPAQAPDSPPLTAYAPADYAAAYRAYTTFTLVNKAFLLLSVPELDHAIARLSQARKRWDSLTKTGYLQYPWEIAVMGAQDDYDACFKHDRLCTGEEGLDPNQWRWILLHPGVGMGLQGFGDNGPPSADAALSLSLEAIGFTRYNQSFSFYWGLSAGVVVNDGDFGDIRPGVFAHVSRWAHVGYLVSLMEDSTRWDATIFLSADLGTALGATFFDE